VQTPVGYECAVKAGEGGVPSTQEARRCLREASCVNGEEEHEGGADPSLAAS